MSAFTSTLLAGLSLASMAQAQLFTLECNNLLVARGDPIKSPGIPNPGSHIHSIVGGTGFNLTMSLTEAPLSADTTCNRPFDHSNYWQPTLMYQASNNSITMIDFQEAAVFYFNRACDYAPGRTECPPDFKSAAPPAGLRIISGDSELRSYNSSDFKQQAIFHTCLTKDASYSPQYPGLPTQACEKIRAESYFPSCWNGVDLDSDDHFKHMAFPVQSYLGGVCPESHPHAIYAVQYQFFYDTAPYPDFTKWTYSMADPTGYGLHGDFLQGWTNQTALEEAVNTCQGPNGFNEAPCSVANGMTEPIKMLPAIPGYYEPLGDKYSGPIADYPGYHVLKGSWTDRVNKTLNYN